MFLNGCSDPTLPAALRLVQALLHSSSITMSLIAPVGTSLTLPAGQYQCRHGGEVLRMAAPISH